LDQFTDLEGVVARIPHQESLAVTREHLERLPLQGKAAVLVQTGWADQWNTERYYEGHPYLTADAAEYLRGLGVKLVGIDSHNIDNTATRSRPVHTTLLGADILIVEHLCNLEMLPEEGFLFSALPPKFRGVGTFPVRAMGKVYTTKE
jgi:kynurenine formamidase